MLCSSALLACGVSDPETRERNQAAATTIQISFDTRPALVVYRDGIDAPWQFASRTTALNYQVAVHGPYTFAYACSVGDSGFSSYAVVQVAQTLADPHVSAQICPVSLGDSTLHTAVGRMAQPGKIALGFDTATTTAPNEIFNLFPTDGTYDLIAMTASDIAIRRGLTITGDVTIAPVVDAAAQGAALGHATFSAGNAMPGESLIVDALIQTATGGFFSLRRGSLIDVPLAPDSVLLASDNQSVSVRANQGATWRSQRRPIRVGNDTVATLPDPLTGPAWSADHLAFDWTSRPANHLFFMTLSGNSPNGTGFSFFETDASAAYLDETGVTGIDFATDFPGFRPEWAIDFSVAYFRDATFQHVDGSGASTSAWTTESIFPDGAGLRARPATAPRAPSPRLLAR